MNSLPISTVILLFISEPVIRLFIRVIRFAIPLNWQFLAEFARSGLTHKEQRQFHPVNPSFYRSKKRKLKFGGFLTLFYVSKLVL